MCIITIAKSTIPTRPAPAAFARPPRPPFARLSAAPAGKPAFRHKAARAPGARRSPGRGGAIPEPRIRPPALYYLLYYKKAAGAPLASRQRAFEKSIWLKGEQRKPARPHISEKRRKPRFFPKQAIYTAGDGTAALFRAGRSRSVSQAAAGQRGGRGHPAAKQAVYNPPFRRAGRTATTAGKRLLPGGCIL